MQDVRSDLQRAKELRSDHFHEEARHLLRTSLKRLEGSAPGGDTDRWKASIFQALGEVSQDLQDWSIALEYLHTAISLFERIGDKMRLAQSHVLAGKVAVSKAMWAQGLKSFENALQTAPGSDRIRWQAREGLGSLEWRRGNPRVALKHVKEALEAAKLDHDPSAIPKISALIGAIYHDLGDMEGSLVEYQAAIDGFKEIGDQRGLARCLNNSGEVHRSLHHFEEAIPLYEGACKVSRSIKFERGVAYGLMNQSMCLIELGRVEEAEPLLAEAAPIVADMEDPVARSALKLEQANLAAAKGDMRLANELFAKAAESYRNQNILYGLGATYLAWGIARARAGDIEAAKIAFTEGEPILRRIEATQLLKELRDEKAKLD